jgi:hypothetical protein
MQVRIQVQYSYPILDFRITNIIYCNKYWGAGVGGASGGIACCNYCVVSKIRLNFVGSSQVRIRVLTVLLVSDLGFQNHEYYIRYYNKYWGGGVGLRGGEAPQRTGTGGPDSSFT